MAGVRSGLKPDTRYHVVVDSGRAPKAGEPANAGPFKLDVEVAPVPARYDTCEAAGVVETGSSIMGTTVGADHNLGTDFYVGGRCRGTFRGPEVVYRFTAPRTGRATVTVMPQAGYDVGLAVLAQCQANACLANEDHRTGQPRVVAFDAVAQQTYFIVVGTASTGSLSSSGSFLLSVVQ